MISTYDDKSTATYDLEGLGKYMRDMLMLEENKARLAKAQTDSFLDGYRTAIHVVEGIMEASNYRVKEVEPCTD